MLLPRDRTFLVVLAIFRFHARLIEDGLKEKSLFTGRAGAIGSVSGADGPLSSSYDGVSYRMEVSLFCSFCSYSRN